MDLDLDLEAIAWMKQAMCANHPDPDLWHYESSLLQDERELAEWRTAEAISICNTCPVKAQCLEEGMKQENMLIFNAIEGTIWGGKMLGERLNIRAKRITFKYKKELPFLRKVNKKLAIIDQ
jgi:hypothetical protein